MKWFSLLYLITITAFAVFSYGFRDSNLVLTSHPVLVKLFQPMYSFVNHERLWAASVFFLFILFLFGVYLFLLKNLPKKIAWTIVAAGFIISFSYPALTHDLFNYITTAKVAFLHKENPYLVMPIEISNEPYLAFTRAANKVALYGPVWIAITAIPHYLGNSAIWPTIISFKFFSLLCYLAFVYLVYGITKSVKNVIFFAFNPLILIETLVSGHNDISMMLFSCFGLYLWQKRKLLGALSVFVGTLVKGASLILFPLLCFKNISWKTLLRSAYILFALVFFIFAPIREELYPWYAVWLVCIASLMDMKKNAFIISFTIVLSFALELRHLPYMWMGYYEGPGPMLRFLVTIIPIGLYFAYCGIRYLIKIHK